MKLVDSSMPGWAKLIFFLGLCLAFFLYVNLTGDESWLLSTEEKGKRRAYVIAQQFINQNYAPPSPATFPSAEEVSIDVIGPETYRINGWVWEPDEKGAPQRVNYLIEVKLQDKTWRTQLLQFKDLNYQGAESNE